MNSETVVAMVHAFPDATLAMSLFDGTKQYTLVPVAHAKKIGSKSASTHVQAGSPAPTQSAATGPCEKTKILNGNCNNAAIQVVDGRYASVYQTEHCSVRPTSPPVLLTEFPPQRPEPQKGHGNFVVGGGGSRGSSLTTKTSQSYRGAISWPDSTVYAPRQKRNYEPDNFADSLRKYPNLSPDRSTKILERLVSYNNMTMKNSNSISKNQRASPLVERKYATLRATTIYETEKGKSHVPDEWPTRDSANKFIKGNYETGELKRSVFGRNFDVHPVRDMTRKAKESYRNITICTKSQVSTQANIPVATKIITTVPREKPSTHNIGLTIAPYVETHNGIENLIPSYCQELSFHIIRTEKCIQTDMALDPEKRTKSSVQTCVSSNDLYETNNKISRYCRKSASTDEFRPTNEYVYEQVKGRSELSNSDENETNNNIRLRMLNKENKVYKCNRKDKVKIKLGRCIKQQLYTHNNNKMYTTALSKELNAKFKNSNIVLRCCNTLKTDILNKTKLNDLKLIESLVKSLLVEIPIKQTDYRGNPVNKTQLLKDIASKIKLLIANTLEHKNFSYKSDLLYILNSIPLDENDMNKTKCVNEIFRKLITRIESIYAINGEGKAQRVDLATRRPFKKQTLNYDLPSDSQLKLFVNQELQDFKNKCNLNICPSTEKDIQMDLIDILIGTFDDFRLGAEEKIKEEILIMLSELINISEHEGIYFVNNLIYNLKDFLGNLKSKKSTSQTFVVLRNSLPNSIVLDRTTTKRVADQHNDFDSYIQQLVQKIETWMNSIKGLNEIDEGLKHIAAHDLAQDIVDRHKYLKLNPNSHFTDADELEYFKYQLFKCIHKICGDNNYEPIDNAAQLMQVIQNIPVPIFRESLQVTDVNLPGCCRSGTKSKHESTSQQRHQSRSDYNKSANVSTINKDIPTTTTLCETDSPVNFSSPEQTQKGSNVIHNDNMCKVNEITKSLKHRTSNNDEKYVNVQADNNISDINEITSTSTQMREEISHNSSKNLNSRESKKYFTNYLQNWVSGIPIITTTKSEEQTDIIRQTIYNGVLKILSNLKLDPEILSNHYVYRDLLDDELEELLKCIPKSEHLIKKKQILKNQLIQQIMNINEEMVNHNTSYKQQLADNIASQMPRKVLGFTGSDIDKICEDILKLNIAETFIVYTMYNKHNNILKASVFKKKLMKKIQEYFDEYKKMHGAEAITLDFASYKDHILNNLYKIPYPNDTTMREEADEVLIALEIEQWFEDLPLYIANSNFEILSRKRYIDTLAEKIHEMEKRKDIIDYENELRHEITRFMTKLPIREKEIENIHFMVEELINRLRNRPKDLVDGTVNRFINLVDTVDYHDFSINMPRCSSFSQSPSARKAQVNESSFFIRDGEKIKDDQPSITNVSAPAVSDQWYSLKEDGRHIQTSEGKENKPGSRQSRTTNTSGSIASQLPKTFGTAHNTRKDNSLEDDSYTSKLQSTEMEESRRVDQRSPNRSSLGQVERLPQSLEHQELIAGPSESVPRFSRSSTHTRERHQDHYMKHNPESIDSTQHLLEPNNQRSLSENISSVPPPECCLHPNRNLLISQPMAGRSTDTHDLGSSTRRFESTPLVTGSRHSDRISFSKPFGQSTPQDHLPTERKDRGRNVRRKAIITEEATDSDENVREEVRCRCMDKICRGRKKMRVYPRCDDCDGRIPPCFPVRFAPYPFYF